MIHHHLAYAFFALLVASPSVGNAQDDPNAETKADTERLKAETDKTKAEAEKITAQADLEKARVTSLGLPSYQGATKLNTNAGDIEAELLTTPAVQLAGEKIAGKVWVANAKPILLLKRDDAFDFGLAGSITAEIDGLSQEYTALGAKPLAQFVPGAVAIISAIAGLIRTDTEVTAANVAVSDDMLLTATAAKLGAHARLPGSLIGTISDPSNSPLLKKLGALAKLDDGARSQRDTLAKANGGKPDDATKAKIDAIDVVRKRYDSFFARITTADAQGAVPIARAARLELLMADTGDVVRVHVEKAGGSLVNNKNIATFFGADPVRVSGGLVVSYIATAPSSGAVTVAGLIQCRTTLARLRRIQDGTVFAKPKPGSADAGNEKPLAVCTP